MGVETNMAQLHAERATIMVHTNKGKHIASYDNAHYPVCLPDMDRGKWKIRTRELKEPVIDNMRHVLRDMPEFVTSAGTYTILSYSDSKLRDTVMMSNTQLEYRTNREFVSKAHGHVLINGLGIGMILRPLFNNTNVKSVTVVEKDPDIIAMVGPHYADLKHLKIVRGNAFTPSMNRQISARYDIVYHDIWPDISPASLTEMHALRSIYKHITEEQHCWSEDICLRMAKQVRRERDQMKAIQNAHSNSTTV